MGLKVKKGIMRDASFITSDPGHAKSGTPHGVEAKINLGEEGNETLFRIQASWCHGGGFWPDLQNRDYNC